MVTLFLFAKVQELQTPEQKVSLEANLDKEFHDSWRDLGNGSYLVATGKPLITSRCNRIGRYHGWLGWFVHRNELGPILWLGE
jgi:hypothetical protein